jgi:hypothetical protein
MAIPKKFFHDQLVLLLLSVNTFLTLVTTVWILLRLDNARSTGFIVEYRDNVGISAYKTGRAADILAFIIFAFLVLIVNTVLSWRVYGHHRKYSLVILSLGTLLLVLSIIISNALLVLVR